MRVLPTVVLAVALSGCYTYGPLHSEAPELGKQVRFELTLTGTDSLAHFLGPDVAAVDGRLVQMTPTSYELGVSAVLMHSGIEQYWKGETVTLPKSLVATVQARTLSWGKTGLLAGIVIATALALQQSGVIGGGSGHGSITNPQ